MTNLFSADRIGVENLEVAVRFLSGFDSLRLLLASILLGLLLSHGAGAITPDDPGTGDVLLSIDYAQSVKPISPYIYGMNSFFNGLPTGTYSGPAIALDRLGGNRWTGYNWETNFSNAGRDYYHVNDRYLVQFQNNTPPGEAVRPSLVSANTHNRAVLVTVPTAGYVSADDYGTVDETEVAPSSRWHELYSKKDTIYPGSSLSLTPNENDNYVFTDEFVNWVENTRDPSVPVFYGLDNEPALWGEKLPPGWQSGDAGNDIYPSPEGRTHPLIHPFEPTFSELRSKVIDHASAIKDVAPNALVFGPTTYGWGAFDTLQDAPDAVTSPTHPGGDASGELHFLEWMLNELAAEETAQGRTLLDVLDVHWYPEATGGGTRITFYGADDTSPDVVEARVQAPRSLWDPSYTESSWIGQWRTWNGSPGNPGPVTFLPRLQRDIDDFKPGTKISITEYNYGGGAHISGAIAQADVLGVFGEQGVFAGNWWNIEGSTAAAAPFVYGAFDMFRNFDGAGGQFGDTSVDAETDDLDSSSVYASLDSENPNQMIVVAINRTDQPLDAAIAVASDRQFDSAEVYQLTSASPTPVQVADIDINLVNAFHYMMPAFSVSTLVLSSPGFAADFDGDGDVDSDDLTHPTLGWEARYGSDLNGNDFLIWQQEFGSGVQALPSSAAVVPEPSAIYLVLTALASLAAMLRSKRLTSICV